MEISNVQTAELNYLGAEYDCDATLDINLIKQVLTCDFLSNYQPEIDCIFLRKIQLLQIS